MFHTLLFWLLTSSTNFNNCPLFYPLFPDSRKNIIPPRIFSPSALVYLPSVWMRSNITFDSVIYPKPHLSSPDYTIIQLTLLQCCMFISSTLSPFVFTVRSCYRWFYYLHRRDEETRAYYIGNIGYRDISQNNLPHTLFSLWPVEQ
jgi:hypothetical protein